jgi:hypothetical protein
MVLGKAMDMASCSSDVGCDSLLYVACVVVMPLIGVFRYEVTKVVWGQSIYYFIKHN